MLFYKKQYFGWAIYRIRFDLLNFHDLIIECIRIAEKVIY